MKKYIIRRIIALAAASVIAFSSCSKAETAEKNIENGKFGGIVLDTQSAAAETSPVTTTRTDFSAAPETSDTSEETTSDAQTETVSQAASADTAPVTSASTAPATKAPETKTTTAAASATTTVTTTSAAATTAAAASVTTTTAETTAESAAAEAPAVSSTSYKKNTYKALNHSNVTAVWISYIEINNLLLGKSESAFRTAIGGIYDNCRTLGINTVYVHVRAYGDAFYYSSLFPFTKYISGALGTKTAYDPLKIMVDEAHKRNISFHAWINPLRMNNSTDISKVSSSYPVGKWYGGAENGKYIVKVGDVWFLNPAYDAAVKLVGDGVREIVSNYDVDGIHIDDYFYPTTEAYFDSAAFAASGSSSLSSFRIANCNKLVREIYNAAHECGTGVVFGASTQGSMSNNLYQLYADTSAWCKGGYIDYFCPQIYYGFENVSQPFKTCTDGWNTLVAGTNIKLYIGLAVYKIGNEDKWAGAAGANEWINTRTMLKRQIEYVNTCSNCSGIALYSYNYLFCDGYRTAAMKEEIANFKPLLAD